MDDENRDEYFRSLITQPPHQSNHNEYNIDCTEKIMVRESAFCQSDNEYSTESEVSVQVSSTSNGQSSIDKITPEKTSIPNSIHCETVQVKREISKTEIKWTN